MSRRPAVCAILAVFACVLLTGCMPKMTIEQIKAQMPQRPAELDRLDAYLGKWQFEGEMKLAMLEQPLKMTGVTESKWDGDGWFMVSRSKMMMEELGDSQALETWTYDIKARKYRSTWVDDMGMIGVGESKYDEKSGIWKMKGTSYGPWGKASSKGTLKFLDEDTMEFTWAEHQGLMKTVEMNGTGKRIR